MRSIRVGALAAVVVAGGCGGGGGGGGGGGVGSCTPRNTAAVTVRATGVSPLAVCVLPGGTVTFTNSDTVPHDIQSGTACPELNLGPIPPSQDRAVTFPAVGVCTYRDQNDPANAAFQGTVAVADAPVIGPGY